MHDGTAGRVLLVDNEDSFVLTLRYQLARWARDVRLVSNDVSLRAVAAYAPTHLVLGAGPGDPRDRKSTGVCGELITRYLGRTPILGVCLGHQLMAHALGATLIRMQYPSHGRESTIVVHDSSTTPSHLFEGLATRQRVMRYHTYVVDARTLPDNVRPVATADDDDCLMAMETEGAAAVQFHPESIGTPNGPVILRNFVITRGSHVQ